MNITCLTTSRANPPAPPSETEIIVEQYSPEWIALVMAGASVRSGNIVDTEGSES